MAKKAHRPPVWDEAIGCYRIELTQGKYALIDAIDFDLANSRLWQANNMRGAWYMFSGKKGTWRSTVKESFHRLAMNPPEGMVVDHISRDTLDNRRCNLRVCTNQQNLANQVVKKKKFSLYKGVSYHAYKNVNKWSAATKFNRKRIHIGCYATQEQAALAYNAKAKELFGEYARLNEVAS